MNSDPQSSTSGAALPAAAGDEQPRAVTLPPRTEIRLDARLQVLEGAGPRTLRLLGELDHGTAPDFDHAVASAVRDGGDLVLDLSGVSFLDSVGVRSLIRAAQGLQSTGSLVLRWPRSAVARTLRLAGVAHIPHVEVVDLSPAYPPPPRRRVPPMVPPRRGGPRRLYTIER
jgi:anti-anti-sigma factor